MLGGEFDKAMELYQKALVIQERLFGTDHPNTASSYNNIAKVYHAQGELDKALEFHL